MTSELSIIPHALPATIDARVGRYTQAADWFVYDLSTKCYRLRSTRTKRFEPGRGVELKELPQILHHIGGPAMLRNFKMTMDAVKDEEGTYQIVDYMDFVPFQPEIHLDEAGLRVLNGWHDPEFESKPGTFPLIRKLLMRLVSDDRAAIEWFLDFLAWRVQKPHGPAGQSVFFATKPGSGKDTLFHILKLIWGDENSLLLPPERLGRQFNSDIAGKALVCANEVIDLNESRQQLHEIIKSYITSHTLSVEKKYQDVLAVKNISTWIFFTNKPETISLQPDDRRFSVFVCKKENKESGWTEYVRKFFWNPKAPELLPEIVEEARALFHELKTRDLSHYTPAPYENEDRRSFLEQGASSVTRFWGDVKERGLAQTLKYYESVSIPAMDKQYDEKKFAVHKKMFHFYYVQFCKDDGVKPMAYQRFTRESMTYLNTPHDLQVEISGKRVRCFDLSKLFEVQPEVKE